jgi:hypothetical protein
MATNYLLPCSCGKRNTVDSGQAGLNVRCECGAELNVPTLRGLSSLERVEAAPRAAAAVPAKVWGPRQGLIFLGSAILVAAAAAAFFFWWRMPEAPSLDPNYQEYNRAFIDSKSPEELMEFWRECQVGITQPMWEMQLDSYDRIVGELTQWEMLVGGVAAVGSILIAVGLTMRSKKP